MSFLRRAAPNQPAAAHWLPPSERLATNGRRHPRAHLSLAVRVRWLGIFALESEVTQTLDAGRRGVLLSLRDPRPESSQVWLTLPYDPAATISGPEIPARVAWTKTTPAGGCLAGIEFADRAQPEQASGIAQHRGKTSSGLFAARPARRRSPRVPVAVLARICGEAFAWPGDAMTYDISSSGLSFVTVRVYEVGARLTIAWPSAGAFTGPPRPVRVVRVATHPADSRLLLVAVEFLPGSARLS